MQKTIRCLPRPWLTAPLLIGSLVVFAWAQPPGGPGGFGGPGGPMGRADIELVKEFDANKDGWLNDEERVPARKALAERPAGGRRGFGPPGGGPGGRPGGGPEGRRGGRRGGPPGGFGGFGGGQRPPAEPGPRVEPADVAAYPNAPLYDPGVLRTVFIDFASDDWEAEMAEFKGTDVDIPATLTVDGKTYPNVGVAFRGASSFMMIPAGHKRSLNVSLDMADPKQRLYGYKSLNLLNSNGDPSMMSTVLYSEMARRHIAAPKANYVQVVINGESWGVFVSVQQFDKVFIKENFADSENGTRWKVPGRPGGDAGLRYLGDDPEAYKTTYEMKSDDDGEVADKAWKRLAELCKVLDETPADKLEEALKPILDVDGALWFLAYDNALVNSDGYWTRASDYSLLLGGDGVFHVLPHDMNESFQARGHGGPGGGGPGGGRGGPGGFGPPGGGPPEGGPPGFFGPPPGPRPRDDDQQGRRPERRGGPGFGPPGGPGGPGGGGGVELDPLVGLDNDRTPLRGRLLAVPELRERYLAHMRQIAEEQLAWDHLGPQVAAHRALIKPAVEKDTRKLATTEAFLASTTTDSEAGDNSLRAFAEKRGKRLLDYEPPKEE